MPRVECEQIVVTRDWMNERIAGLEKMMVDLDPTSDSRFHYSRGQRDILKQLLEQFGSVDTPAGF